MRSRGCLWKPQIQAGQAVFRRDLCQVGHIEKTFSYDNQGPCAFYSSLMRRLLTTMAFLRRLLFPDVLNCLINVEEKKIGVEKKHRGKSRGKKVTCLVNVFSWKSIRSLIFWKGHGHRVSWNTLPLCAGLRLGAWGRAALGLCVSGGGGRNWPLSPESAFCFTLLCMQCVPRESKPWFYSI